MRANNTAQLFTMIGLKLQKYLGRSGWEFTLCTQNSQINEGIITS